MSVSKLSRRALGAVAATSLLVGLLPVAASAATPEPRDITKFACPSDEVPDPGFTDDDTTTAEHQASIACVVWYELAAGKGDSRYAPAEAVNRGQMASFIGNLLVKGGVKLSENPPDAFEDDDNTTHEKRINQLAELGVVEGDRDGKYNAHLPVTRAQMASFLNRAYAEITGTALTSSEDYFTDDEGAFHEDNINAVAGAGIAAGRTSTTYAPSQSVRRDQMATFLARETDLLVEEKKITKPVVKPADVKITATSVPQGSKLTGTIVTQEGVKITSAKVSGCGLTNQSLTLTGTTNAFELTIPLTQPVGDCKLTFTISREGGADVTDEEIIRVTRGASRTDAPELLSVQEVADGDATDDSVLLRFTFDEPLASIPPDHLAFRLYEADADQHTASAARRSSASTAAIDATFTASQLANATTATVAAEATEDAQGVANPEGAVPLTQASRLLKGTEAPDLVHVAPTSDPDDGNVYVFTFDEEIASHPGGNGNYHLIYENGEVRDGTARDHQVQPAEGGEDARAVTFPAPSTGKTVVRAYIDEDTVSDEQQSDSTLGLDGHTNPTQAYTFPATIGSSDTPYLESVTINPSNNTVIYDFNRSVTLVSKTALDEGSFVAYDAEGDEVRTNNATVNNDKVTATFEGSPDPITPTTVGASVARNTVRAATGTKKVNEVDEKRPSATTSVAGNRGGETSAPDLQSVSRSTDGTDSVLTLTFDATVSRATPNPDNDPFGDVVIYQQDGTRTELDLNDASGNECTTQENRVVCRAASSSALGQQIDSALLAAVEYNTVAAAATPTSARNYEASAPIN